MLISCKIQFTHKPIKCNSLKILLITLSLTACLMGISQTHNKEDKLYYYLLDTAKPQFVLDKYIYKKSDNYYIEYPQILPNINNYKKINDNIIKHVFTNMKETGFMIEYNEQNHYESTYAIKLCTNNFISIFFSATRYAYGAARSYTENFALNYDINTASIIMLDDIYTTNDEFWKAIKDVKYGVNMDSFYDYLSGKEISYNQILEIFSVDLYYFTPDSLIIILSNGMFPHEVMLNIPYNAIEQWVR